MGPFGIIVVQIALGTIFCLLADKDYLKELSSYNSYGSSKCKKLNIKKGRLFPDDYIETQAILDYLTNAVKLT